MGLAGTERQGALRPRHVAVPASRPPQTKGCPSSGAREAQGRVRGSPWHPQGPWPPQVHRLAQAWGPIRGERDRGLQLALDEGAQALAVTRVACAVRRGEAAHARAPLHTAAPAPPGILPHRRTGAETVSSNRAAMASSLRTRGRKASSACVRPTVICRRALVDPLH